jgi:hypothetical protein
MSKVVIIKGNNVFSMGNGINEKKLILMLEKGFSILMEQKFERQPEKFVSPR